MTGSGRTENDRKHPREFFSTYTDRRNKAIVKKKKNRQTQVSTAYFSSINNRVSRRYPPTHVERAIYPYDGISLSL